MKKLLAVIFLLATIQFSYAQKMYIWCPDELNPAVQENELENVNVYISVKDVRLLTDNVKDKCESEEITNSITSLIKKSFPNANFKGLESISETDPEGLKIDIRLISYFSEFHTAAWKGKTELEVSIADYRKEDPENIELDISKSKSNGNFGGMRTAKNNLRKSYNKAMIELLGFINSNI